MASHLSPGPARRRLVDAAKLAIGVGGLLGVGVLLTGAAFSDSAEVTAGFTAGTLDITVDGEQGNPVPYELTFVGGDRIVPGQTVYSPLEVANVGDVDSLLTMASSATRDPLGPDTPDALLLSIVGTTGTTCDAATVAGATTTYVTDEPLGAGSFGPTPLVGGGALELCIAVELPDTVIGTGGGSAEVTFEFIAEQDGI